MNYNQRRSNILNTFSQAKQDLEDLNEEIVAEIDSNKSYIQELKEKNKSLSSLKLKNKVSIKIFSKFLG